MPNWIYLKKNKADSSSDVDTVMGEKNTFNKLIVI